MPDSMSTPGSVFSYILANHVPDALAWVRGGETAPAVSGLVKFYRTPYQGLLVAAEFFQLPDGNVKGASGFYAMHIHETGDCSNHFQNTDGHYRLPGELHPDHLGDLPPLLSNQGYAWTAFYDKRFTIEGILGRSVAVHSGPDDFHSQPAGNSGPIIACGQIRVS